MANEDKIFNIAQRLSKLEQTVEERSGSVEEKIDKMSDKLDNLVDEHNQRKGMQKVMMWLAGGVGSLMGYLGGSVAIHTPNVSEKISHIEKVLP